MDKIYIPMFVKIADFLMKRKQVHKLDTIIVITLAAIICGAASWYDIAEFGKQKKTG